MKKQYLLLLDSHRFFAANHNYACLRVLILTVLIFTLLSLIGSTRSDMPEPFGMVLAASSDSLPTTITVIEGRDIRFRRLPRSSGLSQTRVAAVAQDSLGFIWFGTQYGLNRFDGYKSKVFKHEPRQPDSLSCVYVRTLLVDHAGRLWVGCNGYLDRYEPTTESFVHFPIDAGSVGTLSQISDLREDNTGKLWISTTKGLYSFDPNNSGTTRYLHDPKDPDSLSANSISHAHEDRMGRFWVASAGGLEELDIRNGKVKRRAPIRMSVGWSHLDRFGVLWMTGEKLSCALASWDVNARQVKCHSIQYPANQGVGRMNLGQIIEDNDGTLWISSSHGLLKLGSERRELIRYHSNPIDFESLESDKMIAIFRDREGNIWSCFQVTGPNYFARGPKSFDNFTYQRGELVDPLVTSIYEDRRGILWIGSMGGLNRIDRRTGRNVVPPGSGVRNEILSILEDRSQVLFAGTFHRGLERIDPVSGQMSSYVRDKPSNSAKNPIMKLMFDHSGELWAATYGGISHFNPLNGNFTTYTPDPNDAIEYQAIVEDTNGTMWLGAQTGLHHFDPNDQRFTLYQHRTNDVSSLSDNRVNTIHIDRRGGLWVGTQNGLDKYDRINKSFSVYTERDGLGGNVVSCILEDRHGALWMSTNNGVSRLDPQSNKFENYSVADGLPGPDLTGWGACYQSPGGEMFFGGFSGATAFYPDRIAHNEFVPAVALTDFRFSGVSLSPGLNSLLRNSITFSNSVDIPHTQKDFSIEFSALSFFDPETNRYRYRLVGLDNNWHEVGSSQRLASYTTLPVGNYTFEVEGATNHGRWSEPTRLGIRILPAWYQTQTFRSLFALAVVVVLWSLYLLRIKSLEQRFGAILEARVAERTRIARDLHDTVLQSLHGLMFRFQAARNMLPLRADEAMEALDGAIARTEQAITEGRDAIKDLRTEQSDEGDFGRLLASIAADLSHVSEDKENLPAFRVTIEGEPRQLTPLIQDELYRIAHEALQNGFRHAKANQIQLEIRYDRDEFSLRVRDDGAGIAPEILKVGGRSGHWGLAGIRERAQRIGAELNVWSQSGTGTEIKLVIPGKLAYPAKRGNSQSRD